MEKTTEMMDMDPPAPYKWQKLGYLIQAAFWEGCITEEATWKVVKVIINNHIITAV